MSNSGSTYSMQGTGIRYDPRARSPVTPTQAPEQRSITEDSQTGTDDPYDPKNALTPKELDEQKAALEEIERRQQPNQQRGQSSNKSTRTIRSDPTEFHEESRTDDSQTGTDDPYDPKKLLTPEELDEQIAALEEIKRNHQANLQHGQSLNNGTVPIRSAPTEFREEKSNESTAPRPINSIKKSWPSENKFQPKKPPPTKINIKSGQGSCIIASKSTLANANINVESSNGENVIMGFNGPNEFDVVSGDGRIQKAAGGDYHHTPASQLDRGIGAGAHGNQYQQVGNAGGQCIFQQLRNSDQ